MPHFNMIILRGENKMKTEEKYLVEKMFLAKWYIDVRILFKGPFKQKDSEREFLKVLKRKLKDEIIGEPEIIKSELQD